MSSDEFEPMNVCTACKQPVPHGCLCRRDRDCPRCRGRGFNCIDDICHGKGYCIHGDTCWHCEGTGGVPPKVVLVEPDAEAMAIRDYAREHPDIQKARYRSDRPDEDPLTGACYPVAEAYYHLQDCEPEVYCLSWSDIDESLSGTHWYLREPDGERRWIDLSLRLMPPVDLPPFREGTHRGFITGDRPSKRAEKILAAVEGGVEA